MRVTLDLFATDEHIEGRLHAAHRSEPIEFSGVLGLLHVIENLDLEPPPAADSRPSTNGRRTQ